MNKRLPVILFLASIMMLVVTLLFGQSLYYRAQGLHLLTVRIEGEGDVVRNPAKTGYDPGEAVQLTAVAATGWGFTGWNGDASGAGNPATVTMNGDKVITARFSRYEYSLRVTVNGSGRVIPNATAPFYYGKVVRLTATPDWGWNLSAWTGDFPSTANPLDITVTGNHTMNAVFTRNQYQLIVNTTGSGNVTVAPKKETYLHGEQVELTANPSSGFFFGGWGGNVSGSDNPLIITMDSVKTVTATFTNSPPNSGGTTPPPTQVTPTGNNSGSAPGGGGTTTTPTTSVPAAPPPPTGPAVGALPSSGNPPSGGFGTVSAGRTYLIDYLDVNGVFTRDASARSDDGFVKLTIPQGVKAKTAEGVNVSWVELYPIKSGEPALAAPEGGSIVGNCYRLDREGTVFDPPATVTLLYNQASIPVGVKESDLLIGYHSAADQNWVILPGSKIDVEGNTIAAPIRTLGTYAVLGFLPRPVPPSFSLGTPVIQPIAPAAGENLIVSTIVTNDGSTGMYSVKLLVNGVLSGSRDIVLAPDQNQTVSFIVRPDRPGLYSLDLNGTVIPVTVRPADILQVPTTSPHPSPSPSLPASSTTNLPRQTEVTTNQPPATASAATPVTVTTTASPSPEPVSLPTSTLPPPTPATSAPSPTAVKAAPVFPVVWLFSGALVMFVLAFAVTLIRGRNHR